MSEQDAPQKRWLAALDIDGTLLHESGAIADTVAQAVAALAAQGHEVTVATGRSAETSLPILERLGLTPEYAICSNGAVTMKRDLDHAMGYRREIIETFDPKTILTTVRSHLRGGNYAIETEEGLYLYTEPLPDASIGMNAQQVPFEQLLEQKATRVVVMSPDHDTKEFLQIVERMGLRKVSYSIGWTAWLDIAPEGVNKATALERVRGVLGIPRSRVFAIGDGRNDVDMLRWASAKGRGVAMGQATDDVKAVANAVTGSVLENGAAYAMRALLG